jgi:hypothetical protein
MNIETHCSYLHDHSIDRIEYPQSYICSFPFILLWNYSRVLLFKNYMENKWDKSVAVNQKYISKSCLELILKCIFPDLFWDQIRSQHLYVLISSIRWFICGLWRQGRSRWLVQCLAYGLLDSINCKRECKNKNKLKAFAKCHLPNYYTSLFFLPSQTMKYEEIWSYQYGGCVSSCICKELLMNILYVPRLRRIIP